MSSNQTLDKETVLNIAKLARLELSPDDIEKYQHDLSGILALAEQMKDCDTDNVKVMTHPMDANMISFNRLHRKLTKTYILSQK